MQESRGGPATNPDLGCTGSRTNTVGRRRRRRRRRRRSLRRRRFISMGLIKFEEPIP